MLGTKGYAEFQPNIFFNKWPYHVSRRGVDLLHSVNNMTVENFSGEIHLQTEICVDHLGNLCTSKDFFISLTNYQHREPDSCILIPYLA